VGLSYESFALDEVKARIHGQTAVVTGRQKQAGASHSLVNSGTTGASHIDIHTRGRMSTEWLAEQEMKSGSSGCNSTASTGREDRNGAPRRWKRSRVTRRRPGSTTWPSRTTSGSTRSWAARGERARVLRDALVPRRPHGARQARGLGVGSTFQAAGDMRRKRPGQLVMSRSVFRISSLALYFQSLREVVEETATSIR
jgi:hypothetical protein